MKITQTHFFTVVLFALIICAQLANAQMRITEFMYNGNGVGSVGEFVEFTNVGNASIDMSGWSFDDNSRVPGSQSLTAFGVVQAGESVILTDISAGTFRSNWNLCAGVKVIGNNANNLGREDEINLYDSNNLLIDRLTYGDQTYSPGSIRTTVKSGWVKSTGLGINDITKWQLSATSDAEASFNSTLSETGSPGGSARASVAFNPCVVVTGLPTIVMNVSSTTNYIDGGVLSSPLTPYGFSGVISDPTDPAKTLGIDFTINDDVTPVGNLTVTKRSSNTSVVPTANIVITGAGAGRNVKITPVNIGYSNITITVHDGTDSSSYVINYAASSSDPNVTPAGTFFHTGMSDGSDGIPLDNNYYVCGDDELDILNVYSRSASGLPLVSYNYASSLNLPDPSKPEVDVEACTRSVSFSNRTYWTGSMSNGKDPYDNKPNRDRLFAATITGTGANTTFSVNGYVNIRSVLLAWGDANGYNFTASAAQGVNSKALAGFSLEGMVFGPDGTTLYLGLRAPLVPTNARHKAVIAPLLNFETWFNNGSPSGSPTFGTPIELDLDFRGIRDIIRLSNGTYIIVAGSPVDDGGVNNIYKWTGKPADAPIAVNNDAGGVLNIEGLMQMNDSNGQLLLNQIQIISDGGAVNLYNDSNEAKDFANLNLRKYRSDILTGLDLDLCLAFSAAISVNGNTSLCGGSTVLLTAPSGSYTYLWSTGATAQSITVGSSGSYSVTVTNAQSCQSVSAPISVTRALQTDFDNNGITDNIDFLRLLGKYNQSCSGCLEDINNDGIVDNIDFLVILGDFNRACQ